ncbi:MAG: nitroreductase family protein [Planctomycetota bacterium]|jgi:nitroreductase
MAESDLVSPEALLDLIRSRRSIRRYRPDPIPSEMIDQVLEAGRWAPSANNQQPWAFIVVHDKEVQRQIAQHAAYYLDRGARIEEAPLLIVLCGQIRSEIYHRFLRGELGMAGMQMMLQAHALGLGTCWIDGLDQSKIADVLQVPDNMEVIAMLTAGFPIENPVPTSRKPLFEIVHYDIYDSLTLGS